MARRRLNKKVLLLGLLVIFVIAIVAMVLILHYSRDPQQFISDADEAFEQKQYDIADKYYRKAYGYSKTDELKLDVLFKLVELHRNTGRWRDIVGFWVEIIKIDPKNVKARFGKLRYYYIIADSGARVAWKEVKTNASEFLEEADEKVLSENVKDLDYFASIDKLNEQKLGSYLYMVKGRAILENTINGYETNPQESLIEAKSDIEKVITAEPNNPEAYWYLAGITKENGKISAAKGNIEEKEKALRQTEEILEKAVKITENNPQTHINLLRMKVKNQVEEGFDLDKLKLLEPEYLALAKRFDSESDVYNALFEYYFILGPKEMDKAVAAAEKSYELDNKNVQYAINTATILYRKYLINGDIASLNNCIENIKTALELPDAQDEPGPKSFRNKTNRITLYSLLGQCYLEKILDVSFVNIKPQSDENIKQLQQVVYNIGQLYGSGEEPQVRKWQGIFEYISGNKAESIRKLYDTYEQLSTAGGGDWLISYMLGKIFINTSEIGAARIFLFNAIQTGMSSFLFKPEVLLDYAEILIKFRNYENSLAVLKSFDEGFGENAVSRLLKIRAHIGSGQFDEADKELAKMEQNVPNTTILNIALIRAKMAQLEQAMTRKQISKGEVTFNEQQSTDNTSGLNFDVMQKELDAYRNSLEEKVRSLWNLDPNLVEISSILAVCDNYILQEEIDRAKVLVADALKIYPDNLTFLYYNELLKEPNVNATTQEKRSEIELKVLENIKDPVTRALGFGNHYQKINDYEKAVIEYKKALKAKDLDDGAINIPPFEKDDKQKSLQVTAISNLFDIAVNLKDWKLAENTAEVAKRENIDQCQGQFIEARLSLVKKQFKNAVALADKCLLQRPVFSYAYALRGSARASLGDILLAVDDIRKATDFNPLDGSIAKTLMFTLYQRNQRMGANVSDNQKMELRDALMRAMSLNPTEVELQSFFAEYISNEDPGIALAIRQRLQKFLPTVDNTMLLGKMAMRMAVNEKDDSKKKVYFDLAAKNFKEALEIDPGNQDALASYAEYYQLTGKSEEAEKMLIQSKDNDVLFDHYMRSGQIDKAKGVVENAYKENPKDVNTIRKLLIIADITFDKEALKKYSDELLAIDNAKGNQLYQIQAFLKSGLLKDAESKLEIFNEKYPNDPIAQLLNAWLSMQKGLMEQALEQVNKSLQIEPENATAWRLRGEINRFSGKFEQAIDDLKRSKTIFDGDDTRLSLVRAYLGLRLYDDAILELKDTIKRPGVHSEARNLLEWIYTQTGMKRELNDLYRETIKTFPDSITWRVRAGFFAMREKDYVTAEKLFYPAWEKSKELGQPDLASYDGYLTTLAEQKKYDKILEEARQYTEGQFAPISFFRMGQAKKNLGDESTARQYCKKAIELAGTNETMLTNIMVEMLSLFGYEEVEGHCSERLKTDPNSVAANFSMAKAMRLKGEYNKAVNYLDKCIDILKADNIATREFIIEKAMVLQLAFDKTSDNSYLQRSIEVYESLLEKMPNNPEVLNNLAYMLAVNNQMLEKAMEYAKTACEITAENPSFMDTYAYALYKNGKYEQAIQLIQAALQQYEKNKTSVPWDLYEHIGLIREGLKQNSDALMAYRKALEIAGNELPDKVKKRIEASIERVSE